MPKKRRRKPSRTPQFLAIGGLALLVVAVLALKEKPQAADLTAYSGEFPQAQLDHALQSRQPTLAFIHSDNCYQCIVMMETVAQVYPEFADSVTLVDIDVYDENNQGLLKRLGLRYIPTLIFYDQKGKEHVSVGVMEAAQLRNILTELADGD